VKQQQQPKVSAGKHAQGSEQEKKNVRVAGQTDPFDERG
jgi:hypothetical protein